jgi:hypothetical protein
VVHGSGFHRHPNLPGPWLWGFDLFNVHDLGSTKLREYCCSHEIPLLRMGQSPANTTGSPAKGQPVLIWPTPDYGLGRFALIDRPGSKALPFQHPRLYLVSVFVQSGPGAGRPMIDGTLAGYIEHHTRPPAFEGSDGHPYTVSMEVEGTGNLLAPYSGFLVFPRWAETGAGIVGHLETPILIDGKSREEVEEKLGALTLSEVQGLLEGAIGRRSNEA